MIAENLNKWLTLGTNLAVFAGLVLVALEINQTQTQLEIDALADGADNFTQAMETLSGNNELSSLIYRAETDFERLDDFERWRVTKYLDGYFVMSEQDFTVMSQTDGSIPSFSYDWRVNMTLPMFKAYWEQKGTRFHPDFQQFIEEVSSE